MAEDQVLIFPDTVSVLNASNGSLVYLVGTVRFSQKNEENIAQVYNTNTNNK